MHYAGYDYKSTKVIFLLLYWCWYIYQYFRIKLLWYIHVRQLSTNTPVDPLSWWRHQMETFCALLALCEGNPPVTGGFPSQRPVTRSFDVFFICAWINRYQPLSKQSWGWWFGHHRGHYDVTVIWHAARIVMSLPFLRFREFIKHTTGLYHKWHIR